MYKVKKEDLIGDLEGLPIEIVQKMIEHQFAQTGKCDVLIFQTESDLSHSDGGFTWRVTSEKYNFWMQVILFRNFDLFFEKYPKNQLDLRDLVSKWAEEKEKYLAIAHTLKTIFENLDAKIQDKCGQKFSLPDFYFVGDWGWHKLNFMVKKPHLSHYNGFGKATDFCLVYHGPKIEDHWPISLKELKALNEGLSNILLEDIFDEVVKLNS